MRSKILSPTGQCQQSQDGKMSSNGEKPTELNHSNIKQAKTQEMRAEAETEIEAVAEGEEAETEAPMNQEIEAMV